MRLTGVTSRRGMIILAVLLIVPIAALVASAGMYAADAELSSARVSLRETQARLLAWSGVQAVMAELADQRDAIVEGRQPRVTDTWELFTEGDQRAIVRLLPVGDGDAKIESENAKLDLNAASAEMLAKAPGLSDDLAKAIVAARSRRFLSVADLARVPGVTAEMLGEAGTSDGENGGSKRSTSGQADGSSAALDRVLTVCSFMPNIQFGVGDKASEHRGQRRINVNGGDSDALEKGLEARFPEDAALNRKQGLSDKLKGVLKAAGKFGNAGDLVGALLQANVETSDWARVMDLFATSDDPYLTGQIDLNQASAAVLACIPGIGTAEADQIVQARQRLDVSVLTSPAWLVTESILKPDAFKQAAPYLTTRSFQWRVLIEAGLTKGEERERGATGDVPLASRVVLEAVIDVASQRVRLASLRDVTLLSSQREMYAAAARDAEKQGETAAAEPPVPATPPQEPPASLPVVSSDPAKDTSQDAPAAQGPPSQSRINDPRFGRWTAGHAGTGEQP